MYYVVGADLGGTYSRFSFYSWTRGFELEALTTPTIRLRNSDFGSFAELLREADRLLVEHSTGRTLSFGQARMICVAAAGVYHPDRKTVSRPQAYWDGEADLGSAFDALGVREEAWCVKNDFEAQVAFVLSGAADQHLQTVLDGEAPRGEFDIVLGPGTGLGVAAIAPERQANGVLQRIIRTELGNAPIGYPHSDALRRVWDRAMRVLRSDFGVTSPRWEDFISGPGLERLHRCLNMGSQADTEEIGAAIASGRFGSTREAFAELLALRCRDLCYGYWLPRRVILTGGVLEKTPQLVMGSSRFATVFRAFPVAEDVLADVPVYLLTEQDSGVFGAAWLALVHSRAEPWAPKSVL